jgi:hypothetical protein
MISEPPEILNLERPHPVMSGGNAVSARKPGQEDYPALAYQNVSMQRDNGKWFWPRCQ